jgi:hypothetical protein
MLKETIHFKEMLKERKISPQWVEQTLRKPDLVEHKQDGTTHYIKKISDYNNRWLRVVVNNNVNPSRLITTFFDRTLRRKLL